MILAIRIDRLEQIAFDVEVAEAIKIPGFFASLRMTRIFASILNTEML